MTIFTRETIGYSDAGQPDKKFFKWDLSNGQLTDWDIVGYGLLDNVPESPSPNHLSWTLSHHIITISFSSKALGYIGFNFQFLDFG
ncbi:uncharacterized protein OCT59_014533 [Rhizophagus irregularis]|uniref:uncharacterized protein n=1 Tax=Rhizophagus irregularis TaxID=588596 RepID=UPI003328F61B|nr:hypothetical protein OCT59_014533 [Rhizophagus irregularis]